MQSGARQAGFTLIELLVVLIILGIVISLATLWVRPISAAQQVRQTAQQCQRIILAAEQTAQLTPAVLGLVVQPTGLQFMQYAQVRDRLQWRRLHPDHLSQPNLFSAHGVIVTRTPAQPTYLVVAPSGEVTPFTLQFTDAKHTVSLRLTVNAAGAVALSPLQSRSR